LDGTIPVAEPLPTKATKKWLDVQEEKENYFRMANTTEIAAEVMEETQKLHTALMCSTNIKGMISKQMKHSTVTIAAGLTAMHHRADETKAKEEIEELLKQVERERREKERLQEKLQEKCRQYERIEKQFEIKQIRECSMKGTAIPDTLVREVEKEAGNELQKAPLPPKGGGELKGKRERRASLPLKSGEALSSLKEEGKGRDSVVKEVAKPSKTGKRKLPTQPQVPSKKVAPRVVSDVMVTPPNNMDPEMQSILVRAERKADELRQELNSILAQIDRIKQAACIQNVSPVLDTSAGASRREDKQSKSGKVKEEKGQAKKRGSPGPQKKSQALKVPPRRRGKGNKRLWEIHHPQRGSCSRKACRPRILGDGY